MSSPYKYDLLGGGHSINDDPHSVTYASTPLNTYSQVGGEREEFIRSETPYGEEDEIDEPPEEECKTLGAEQEVVQEKGKSLGDKKIGNWGSFYFIINQIYGPGVLAIPIVFQQSGILVTTIMLTFFLVISCLAATMLCEAIARIPDNENFEKRIEYGTVVRYYYGKKWHFLFQIFLNFTIQAYLIASIVVCAQSLDQFLVSRAGNTWGFEFFPNTGFHAYSDAGYVYLPCQTSMILSVGYIMICVLVIPMGMINLDSNVAFVQSVSFWSLAILMTEFVINFCLEHPDPSRATFIEKDGQYTQISSVFIFSWAYVMFIPSWINEKEPSVNINKAVWSSGITSWVGYLFIGLLAAWAYPNIDVDNVLEYMTDPTKTQIKVTVIAAYLFSLGVIAPGIPVCSITCRYNLYVGKICGKKWSYFWGVIAPWIIGFIFSQGQFFADLLNWSSLICNGIVNFVIPMLLYYKVMKTRHNREYITKTVQAIPTWFQLRARPVTLILVGLTMASIVAQIIMIGLNPSLIETAPPSYCNSTSTNTTGTNSTMTNNTLVAYWL
eukprot:TRINITY_DN845_c0_g1_i4.p1 TRINITY_DN845_c0_g1~~TRINITY_DN845_c0_g1_i4.p1  ORF type:complete len:552 (+),score=101.86 TRINITY_DN845_c0_g1_i4:287-1942(+)